MVAKFFSCDIHTDTDKNHRTILRGGLRVFSNFLKFRFFEKVGENVQSFSPDFPKIFVSVDFQQSKVVKNDS